eukprot:Amastigsp_a339562_118.p4 type:complete len:125 gc:universal Amastigsp_a339562_118:1163-1537(+)
METSASSQWRACESLGSRAATSAPARSESKRSTTPCARTRSSSSAATTPQTAAGRLSSRTRTPRKTSSLGSCASASAPSLRSAQSSRALPARSRLSVSCMCTARRCRSTLATRQSFSIRATARC